MPRDPDRAGCGSDDVLPWHPHVLDAVPGPITGLPHVARAEGWWDGLDDRRGRRDVDHDPDAGGDPDGGERQHRGAEKRNDRSSPHASIITVDGCSLP